MRLLLADAHALMRAGLRRLIEGVPGMAVIGEAADGQHLLELTGKLHPDALLIDLKLNGMSGADALVQLRRHYPQVSVLVVSALTGAHQVRSALKLGALGFLDKNADSTELPLALSALSKQQVYLSPSVAQYALDRRRNPRQDEEDAVLSMRQRQMMQLIARGKSTKEIAALMGVSVKTVETHRARAMQTLGLHGTNALMRYAISQGLENPEH